jgi:hypothetical protein
MLIVLKLDDITMKFKVRLLGATDRKDSKWQKRKFA